MAMETKLKPETERILEDAHHWLLIMEDPESTDADRKAFEAWLEADPSHADMYDRAITVRAAIKSLSKEDIDSDLHYENSDGRFSSLARRASSLFSGMRPRVAIGAVLTAGVAMLVVSLMFSTEPLFVPVTDPIFEDYESGVGEIRFVTLADGTEVTLGARSSISTRYDADQRVVELNSGAAFFDVVPDETRPFSVEAARLTATALGTKFDVRNNAGMYRVAVAEGNVKVSYPFTFKGIAMWIRSARTLGAGQEVLATQIDGLQSVSNIDIANVAAWRSERLIYSGATVAEFVADLNRYSTLPIVVDERASRLNELQIRGVFRGQEVDRLLMSLTEIHPIEVDRSDPLRIILRAKSKK